MRHLYIFVAGPALSGRSTWLQSILSMEGVFLGKSWLTLAIEGRHVRLGSGETIVLHAALPYLANLWVPSYEAAATGEVEWIREVGKQVLAFLPKVEGVVFVADSREFRQDANSDVLMRLLVELENAGHDVSNLPFVFAFNHRDHASAVSCELMARCLASARCAHVETIFDAGLGAPDALERLVSLIDGGSVPTFPTEDRIEQSPSPLGMPEILFADLTVPILRSGQGHAIVRSTKHRSTLQLDEGAFARAWPKVVQHPRTFVPGSYVVEVVQRHVELDVHGSLRRSPARSIAARLSLRNGRVERREMLGGPESAPCTFVLIGSLESVSAATQGGISDTAYLETRSAGACVAVRDGGVFQPAETGDLCILDIGTDNEIHTWVGYDHERRWVEVIVCGDDGASTGRLCGVS